MKPIREAPSITNFASGISQMDSKVFFTEGMAGGLELKLPKPGWTGFYLSSSSCGSLKLPRQTFLTDLHYAHL